MAATSSVSSSPPPSPPAAGGAPLPPFKFEEVSAEVLEERCANAINLATDAHRFSGNSPLKAIEIGNCINIFAIEYAGGKVDSIGCFHVGSGFSAEAIEQILREELVVDGTGDFNFYLIGGNDSTAPALLGNIHTAIAAITGGTGCIREELIHAFSGRYVDAAVTMQGELLYSIRQE